MDTEKKKRKKKDPYKLKKFKKALAKALLIEIAIILLFSLGIYENRKPTADNTYQVTGKIEDYRIKKTRHHLYFYFWQNGTKYRLDSFHDRLRLDSYEKRISEIMKEDEIALTVMDTFRLGKTIVDMRSETEIYLDIEEEQSYRTSQRSLMIISFTIIFVFFSGLATIPVLHWYESPKHNHKKKKS